MMDSSFSSSSSVPILSSTSSEQQDGSNSKSTVVTNSSSVNSVTMKEERSTFSPSRKETNIPHPTYQLPAVNAASIASEHANYVVNQQQYWPHYSASVPPSYGTVTYNNQTYIFPTMITPLQQVASSLPYYIPNMPGAPWNHSNEGYINDSLRIRNIDGLDRGNTAPSSSTNTSIPDNNNYYNNGTGSMESPTRSKNRRSLSPRRNISSPNGSSVGATYPSSIYNHNGTSLVSMLQFTSSSSSSSSSTTPVSTPVSRLWENGAWNKLITLLTMYPDQQNDIPRSWGQSLLSLSTASLAAASLSSTSSPENTLQLREEIWKRIQKTLLAYAVTFQPGPKKGLQFQTQATFAEEEKKNENISSPTPPHYDDDPAYTLDLSHLPFPELFISSSSSSTTVTSPSSRSSLGTNNSSAFIKNTSYNNTSSSSSLPTIPRGLLLPSLPPYIKSLNLSNNNLQELPSDLPDRFPDLIKLNLAGNNISLLPKEWNNQLDTAFPTLEYLDISDNQLTKLSTFWPTNIQYLHVSKNFITGLPVGLPSSLKELYIQNNPYLTDIYSKGKTEPRPTLPFHLHFKNLRIFDCSYTKLQNLPSVLPPILEQLICVSADLKELPPTVSTHSTLTVINCSNNRILQLPNMPNTLRVLNLKGNMVDPFWYDNQLNRMERYTTNPHIPSDCQVIDDKVHEIIGFTDKENSWQQALWIKVSRLLSLEQHNRAGESMVSSDTTTDNDSLNRNRNGSSTETFSSLIDIIAPPAWPCEIIFSGNSSSLEPTVKETIIQQNRNYIWKNICDWILQGKPQVSLALTILLKKKNTNKVVPDSSTSKASILPLLSSLPCLPRSIQSLDLSDSNLLTLPEDLSTLLPQLRCLRIQGARYLHELPSTIPVLLEELYIINCGVTKLPPTWNNMRALTPLLETFDISGNGLEALPTRWPDNLAVLRCSTNCISTVTDSLPKSLTELRIDNNPTLRFLPYGEVFGQQLKDLEILSCNNNPFLTNLPTLVPRSLLELDCHNSSIRNLPSSIGDCIKLKKVDASLCHLKHIPEEIGKCMNLESLNIHDNQLIDLPATIAKCLRLHTLDITNNQLSTGQLVFPDSLAVLKMKGNKLHTRMIPNRLPRALRIFECDDDVLRKWLLPAVESNHLEILLTILACLGAHIPNLTTLPTSQSPRSPHSPNQSPQGGSSSPRIDGGGSESPRAFQSGRLSPRGIETVSETPLSTRSMMVPGNVSPQGLEGESSISPKPELLIPDGDVSHSPSSSGRISPRTTMLAARSVSPRRLTEALYANLGGRISPRVPLPFLEAMAQDSEAMEQDGKHKTLLLSKDTVALLYYALIKACQLGNAATVSALLHAGADPLLDPMPDPPSELAGVIMNIPATTTTTTSTGTTALNANLYVSTGSKSIAKDPVNNNSSSSTYFPPLSTAVLGGHAEVVAVIIEHLQELDAIDEETDPSEAKENSSTLHGRAATLVTKPCSYMPYKLSPLQLSIITNGKSVYGWQSQTASNANALPSSVLASLTVNKVSDRKIIERKLAVLRALLEAKPDVNVPIILDYDNPKNNHVLITNDPNIIIIIPGGTCLHLAVASGFREAVAALLAVKADPNIKDNLGYVPLWYATIYATETYADVVTALLHSGARIDTNTSSSLGGIIHQLVTLPWTMANTVLTSHKYNSNSATTKESPQAINTASRYKDKELRDREIERRVEILKALFQGMRKQHSGVLTTAENSDIVFGLFTNYFAKGTTTPSHLAALSNCLPLLEVIIKEMVPKLSSNNIAYLTNVTNEKNETSLHCAITCNSNLQIIKFLLSSGANISVKDNMGRTPLYLAINNYISTLTSSTVSATSNNNSLVPTGTMNNADIVRKVIDYLLEAGANPLDEDLAGVSSLKIAHEGAVTTLAGYKPTETVTVLGTHGSVPPSITTVNGGLLFDLLTAIIRNIHHQPTLHNTDIQRIMGKGLSESGVDIFTLNRDGRNLAHVCATIGSLSCLQILTDIAQQSSPPNSSTTTNSKTFFLSLPDTKGVPPIHAAIEYGNLAVMLWLVQEGIEPFRLVTNSQKNSTVLSTVFERILNYARNGSESTSNVSSVQRSTSNEQYHQQQRFENILRAVELMVPLLEHVLHRIPSPDALTHHIPAVPELHRQTSNPGLLMNTSSHTLPSPPPPPPPSVPTDNPGDHSSSVSSTPNASAVSIAQQYITLGDIEGIRKLGDEYYQIVRQSSTVLSSSSSVPYGTSSSNSSGNNGNKVSNMENFDKLRHIIHSAPFARLHRIMDHRGVTTIDELSHQHSHYTIEHALNG